MAEVSGAGAGGGLLELDLVVTLATGESGCDGFVDGFCFFDRGALLVSASTGGGAVRSMGGEVVEHVAAAAAAAAAVAAFAAAMRADFRVER